MHPDAKKIAPKVKYEWDMFDWLAQRIANEYKASSQQERNLLTEDFLLHARVLRDFFVRNPKHDDVSARHFFNDESTWTAESSSLCAYLQQNRIRLNKKLAHLTYSRLKLDEQWDFSAIRKEVFDAWHKFCSLLTAPARQWLM